MIKGNKGQALIEVALTLPLILILILGAVDFGRMFYTKLVLTNAAREGANYLAYHPDAIENAKQAAVNEAFSLGLDLKSEDVSVATEDGTCCSDGEPIIVTAKKTIDLIFGGFFQAVGLTNSKSLELTGTSRMMVQL